MQHARTVPLGLPRGVGLAWVLLLPLLATPGSAQENLAHELEARLAEPELTGVERIETSLARTRALLSWHLPTALEACREAREEAARNGRRDYEALALAIEARIRAKLDGATTAVELLEEARGRMPADAPPPIRGRFAIVEAGLHQLLDVHGRAAVCLREALELAEQGDSKRLMADCLLELHDLLYVTGTGHEPADDLSAAEALFTELEDRRGLRRVRMRWADVWMMQGHEDRAMATLHEVAEEAAETGDLSALWNVRMKLYGAALSHGDTDLAISFAEENLETAAQMEDQVLLSWSLDSKAWAHLAADEPAMAEPYIVDALAIATRIGGSALLVAILESASELSLAKADPEALLHYQQLWDDQYNVDGADEDRAIADNVLRELRTARREHHDRIAKWEAAQAESESRAAFYRWVAAVTALVFTSALAALFFAGKRRAERMHDQLREQTRRAQENERARQRLERHVSQLERIDGLGMLAAGIAHDFNNILCGILGNAEALRDTNNRAHLEMADAIVSSSLRAADLCTRLLDYGKPTPDDPEIMDLREIVDGARDLLKVSGGTGTVECVTGEQPVLARVDRTGVERVVVNLVANARDTSVGASRVTVHLRTESPVAAPDDGSAWFGQIDRSAAHAVLEVEDDGSGIADDRLRRIFDPFFTTKFEGRGIGLSASYGIVTAHGGAFRVRSEVGRGSRFAAYLPLADLHEPQNGELDVVELEPQPSPAAMKARVLVVDDEGTIASFVKRALEVSGYAVETAQSGAEAIEVLTQDRDVDLLLLDMSMPSMDGSELLTEVRRLGLEQPAVIMSGHGDDFVQDRLSGLDVAATLRKPFLLEDLRECVATIVARTNGHATSKPARDTAGSAS